MPCWHIDEKTCSPIGVNIQKPPQLEGKTCPLEIDRNKNHIVLEPQLSSQPHKKKTYEIKSTRVGSTMTTFTNVQTPSTNNTM